MVKERIINAARSRHPSYLKAFLSEKGLTDTNCHFDAIELSLYIGRRLQTDNDWLVDKLAQVEKQRVIDDEVW